MTAEGRRLVIRILGPLEVEVDGVAVPPPAARERRLLAALLSADGRMVTTGRLVDAIWGEDPPAQARSILHNVVARLRRTIGDSAVVRHPAGYALDMAPVTTDAMTARNLIRQADGAAPTHAVELYDRALQQWRGPAAADLGDAMRATADTLTELRLRAREHRADALLAAGRPGDAADALAELIDDQPLRERPVVLMMQAQVRLGAIPDALETFRRHREVLADELGLDPGPAARALHERILRGDVPQPAPTEPVNPAGAPGSRAAAAPAHRGLLGRESALDAVADLLRAAPLVTVVGPGGVGKTTLARHLAHEWDRSSWVDLSAVGDGGVVPTIARALGIAARPGVDLLVEVGDRLAGAQGLLVLDNCEHVIGDVVPVVEQLVAGRLDCRILTTSRERLDVREEQVFPLWPLRLPAPEEADASAPAVALFLERATAADPALLVDDRALRRIGSICRRLDGLPLAIELAASRAGALTIDDLDARIGSRLDLLRGSSRSRTPRHRTMSAAIAWSYDLLELDERSALDGLAAVHGTFDLAAAERLLSQLGLDIGSVADIVGRLVDRSMLARAHPAGSGRYRMLATVRAYIDVVMTPARRPAVSQAHARWCAEFAMDARDGLRGPTEGAWAARVEERLDDLRAAVDWACRSGQTDLGADILESIQGWAIVRMRRDVLGWAETMLDAERAASGDRLARIFIVASASAWFSGRPDDAVTLARSAIAETCAAAGTLAGAHSRLADHAIVIGRPDLALPHYERAEALAIEAGRPGDAAVSLAGRTLAASRTGALTDQATLMSDLGRAVDLARRSGHPSSIAFVQYFVADALARENPAQALLALGECLQIADDTHNPVGARVSVLAAVAVLERWANPTAPAPEGPTAFEQWVAGGEGTMRDACRRLRPLVDAAHRPEMVAELDGALTTAGRAPYDAARSAIAVLLPMATAAGPRTTAG